MCSVQGLEVFERMGIPPLIPPCMLGPCNCTMRNTVMVDMFINVINRDESIWLLTGFPRVNSWSEGDIMDWQQCTLTCVHHVIMCAIVKTLQYQLFVEKSWTHVQRLVLRVTCNIHGLECRDVPGQCSPPRVFQQTLCLPLFVGRTL